MKRGFMRIVEVTIALILMLAFMTTLLQQNTPLPQATKNTRVLQRYAEDMKNMICNSDKDSRLLLTFDPIDYINTSLNYVAPINMKFNVLVFHDNDVLVREFGYGLPDLVQSPVDIATSSCLIGNETEYIRTVVVQAWY